MIRILALAVTESSPDYQNEIVEVLKRRANHGQFVRTICSNAIKQKQPPRNIHSQPNLGTIPDQKASEVVRSPARFILKIY